MDYDGEVEVVAEVWEEMEKFFLKRLAWGGGEVFRGDAPLEPIGVGRLLVVLFSRIYLRTSVAV